MSASLLAPLADWVSAYDARRCDTEDRARLFATMLDYASALFSGDGHKLAEPYREALAGPEQGTGTCSIIALKRRVPLQVAAATNAAIAHLWEVDDAHRSSTSHPGVTVVPVVIALAEAFPDLPRTRLLGAVVTGYEAILRIGAWLGAEHYAVCHTTATAGCFGATAAACHALGFDSDATLAAFGHAGTQAAGLWQFLDDGRTAAKAFHCAMPVRSGLTATFLARAGIPGAPHILEGARGMMRAWRLDGGDPSLLRPAGRAMIHDVTIKGWPTCGQMHSALDCASELAQAVVRSPDDVTSVVVEMPQACLDIASGTNPLNVASAKFSTSFCIAAVLSGQPPTFTGLSPALLNDAAVRALATRVDLRADPDFTGRFPKERPARVTVVFGDGRTISHERASRRGDPEEPWSEPDLVKRAGDILRLAPWAVDIEGLVGWSRGFAAAGDFPWCAGDLFTMAGTRPRREAIA
jgi:2-methylcitrate dehydratase PrpD